MKYSERDTLPRTFNTRKQAQEFADTDRQRDEYRARVFEQDRTRQYEWDADENAQIDGLAQKLRENPEQWTWNGPSHFVDMSRMQHVKDAEALESRNWLDCDFYHAEKRRLMAARREAFRRAGLEL